MIVRAIGIGLTGGLASASRRDRTGAGNSLIREGMARPGSCTVYAFSFFPENGFVPLLFFSQK
jgi:hypothetical protein